MDLILKIIRKLLALVGILPGGVCVLVSVYMNVVAAAPAT